MGRLPQPSQRAPDELAPLGVTEGTVRWCVGIDHIADLLVDPDPALAAL